MECMISGRRHPSGERNAETMNSFEEVVCATLEKKLLTYKAFHTATELLQQALEGEEMTTACRLIDRREALMTDIDGLDRRLRDQRRLILSRGDPALVGKMARLSADLDETLKQILSANQACDAIAAGRCEALRKDLAAIRRHGGGLHAYAHKATGRPKFLNVKT